jgi:serine/threonine protein phosphatase PrpC
MFSRSKLTDPAGALNMSRALGDLELKKPRVNRLAAHNLSDLDGVETGVSPGKTATADLVSIEAHFASRTLEGQNLLLICSDGVGDGNDAETATRFATTMKTQGKTAEQIAKEITKRAGKATGADNCTVVVVCLEAES